MECCLPLAAHPPWESKAKRRRAWGAIAGDRRRSYPLRSAKAAVAERPLCESSDAMLEQELLELLGPPSSHDELSGVQTTAGKTRRTRGASWVIAPLLAPRILGYVVPIYCVGGLKTAWCLVNPERLTYIASCDGKSVCPKENALGRIANAVLKQQQQRNASRIVCEASMRCSER